jgi:ferritin-like metal-binding protein YciE
MQLNSLNDVLEDQLADLLSAEQQLVEALPKIAAAASSNELREALQNHLQETRGHLQRLKDITPSLAATAPSKKCVGMEGLLREGEEIIKGEGDPLAKDAALIAAAQRVEHYEIAAYGTARTLADELGLDDAKDALDQTLDEEANADKLLTKIATGGMFRSGVNERATSA